MICSFVIMPRCYPTSMYLIFPVVTAKPISLYAFNNTFAFLSTAINGHFVLFPDYSTVFEGRHKDFRASFKSIQGKQRLLMMSNWPDESLQESYKWKRLISHQVIYLFTHNHHHVAFMGMVHFWPVPVSLQLNEGIKYVKIYLIRLIFPSSLVKM